MTHPEENAMEKHNTGTREEWLAARLELLEAEKELTHRSDDVARRRQALPWVRVDKPYRFETEQGPASLADLFRGRSQLLVYHFMFGPDYTAGCPACSSIADGFDGSVVHLAHHDVMFWAVSSAPFAKLQAFRQRMGWSFPWASAASREFNQDFIVSINKRQQELETQAATEEQEKIAATVGTDWQTYTRERPGMSSFALQEGVVYHTYSASDRGLDVLWDLYQWLDRAPLGRNEKSFWFRRHDEYSAR